MARWRGRIIAEAEEAAARAMERIGRIANMMNVCTRCVEGVYELEKVE
jgi:hypothetical protein